MPPNCRNRKRNRKHKCISEGFSSTFDSHEDCTENQNKDRKFLTKLIQIDLSGVLFSDVVFKRDAIFPTSVSIPIPVTTNFPLPYVTKLPENTMFTRSPSGTSPSIKSMLFYRNVFFCQCALIYFETCLFDNPSIRRNLISCFQNDNITDCHFPGRDLRDSITLFFGLWSGRLHFRLFRDFFRLHSLHRSKQNCIDCDDNQ